MKVTGSYAALAVFTAAANARNLELPLPTASLELPSDGFTPKPTNGPAIHELLRRADSTSVTTVLVAPDNTCGYISGRPGAAYSCMGTDATCIFFTASSTRAGAVACCNSVECNLRVQCIDYEGYWSKSQCVGGCEVDAYTLKCTDSKMPYCNTISFDGNIRDFFCYNAEITTPQGAQTTYKGGDFRSFSPLALSDTTSQSLRIETTPVVGGAGATATNDGPKTATITSGGGGGSGGDSKKSSTPVGPIVGGVVGGVAAIGIGGIALFFFLRNKKKNKQAAAPAAAVAPAPPPVYQPPMEQQQQPGAGFQQMPPNQGQPYYDPKNPYAQPNTQYIQPNGTGFVPVQGQQDMTSPVGTMPVSPTGTTITDPRLGAQTTSPVPSFNSYNTVPVNQPQAYQPQEAVIHEAPANTAEERRKEVHEMA